MNEDDVLYERSRVVKYDWAGMLTKKTGLVFEVEGEYSEERGCEAGAEWTYFTTRDIHPGGKGEIVVWSQFREISGDDRVEMIEMARLLVGWFVSQKDWGGIDASLYLRTADGLKEVTTWNMC